MPVIKRRYRIVSFRLSDEEYEAMMAGCASRGSRSISEFARSAAYEYANGDADSSVRVLKNRVEELDRLVHSLSLRVEESAGGNGRKGG